MDNAPAQSVLVEGFSNLNIMRQIGLMIGLAASIALGFAIVLWSQEPNYRPLAGNLDSYTSNQVADILQQNEIRFKVDPNSGMLLVDSDQLHIARMRLAGSGVSLSSNKGYELLDEEQSLGTSQFMENAKYLRSLEGELARTITSLYNVRNSRVHIAIPKRSVFVRDDNKPSVSVFLELYAGRGVEQKQVVAIMNLVASSIPELEPDSVTVIDQNGQLLSDQDPDSDISLANKQFEYTRKTEDVLIKRIHNLLIPIVGNGHYKAEVSADIDFTMIEQTDEIYNPDLPALRSEQTLEEQKSGVTDGASGIPGALSNQPPAAGAAPEQAAAAINAANETGGNSQSRNQSTRNYELDRTLSYTKHQSGRIKRLSIAVIMDDLPSEGGERQAWTDLELQRISALIKDAIGFSAQRGDSLNVMNTSFVKPEIAEPLPEPTLLEQPWVWDLAKQGAGALFLIVLVFGLLRPILRTLAQAGTDSVADSMAALPGMDAGGNTDGLPSDTLSLSGPGGSNMLGASAGFDNQLNAVKGLVAEDPGRVAQVVKQWVAADDG